MSASSINSLNNNYLQSILNSALQPAGVSSNSTSSSISATSSQPADHGQLSPLAQVLSTLQQLQETNPSEYQQVTSKIAANLQNAAQTASSQGNTTAANQLNQLATDFTNASQSGQLPNISDLAQAVGGGGGGHHHHHHGGGFSSEGSSSSSSSTTGSSSTSSSASGPAQVLSPLPGSSTQGDSWNPISIIVNTLNGAGVAVTNV